MFKARPWLAVLPLLAPLLVACPSSASAQLEALRNADDQYIDGLREQGMSDLLERFSEVDPPEDPIARLALDVSLKEFVASDLLVRATRASREQDFAKANQFFQDSRATFEEVLAAQRKLIADYPNDERLPIWQTDFAQMLIDRYLPRYFPNVMWHYEFGLPSDEHKQAFEASMIEALAVTSDASNRFGLIGSRVSADGALRAKLEEMQIWWMIQDYTAINTPYWLAHAAHGVSLLPDDHPYFTAGNKVRGQRATASEERERLRNRVVDECSGALATDERTSLVAKLLSGKTLVRSSNIDDVDDGVELYLEKVITESPSTYHGYLATLGKAIGRLNGGDLDIAEVILSGMDSHQYVRSDPTVVSRLLAADLLFRILSDQADKAPANEQQAKLAQAFEKAYIPLIDNDDDPRFKQVLFTRWAQSIGDEVDPASLPAMVRMGVGEQLTSQGGGMAQAAVQASRAGASAQWRGQATQAQTLLNRAVKFNVTLTGKDISAGPVQARALFNLGTSYYWLAELDKAIKGKDIGWAPYFKVAKTWLEVAVRAPEADNAQEALGYAIGLLLPVDVALNKDSIREPEVRAVYKQAFDLINERWPQSEAAHNNRLYAGFHLYEKVGDLQKAAEVYSALSRTHRDYFQAKRQMLYAMHRSYRGQADKLRLMNATQPPNTPPQGQDPEAFNKEKLLWQREHDMLVVDINRKRDLIVEEAELVAIDAEDAVDNLRDPTQRFAAATALGASRVVLAGMEADAGQTDTAMQMLEGFEKQYSPTGPYAALVAQQLDREDAANATLQGLIQSAQEQRILTLLSAKDTDKMAVQAKEMMQQSPGVAAAVINGVLQRIRAEIDREKRAIEAAAFEVQREQAEKNIRFLANAAVDLGQLLVAWAKAQGFDAKTMAAYEMPLADSLMLAGRGPEALKIMQPILKMFPNSFNILIRTGKANLAVYRQQGKNPQHYEGARKALAKVINYYNAQPTKPADYWEAWLTLFELMDAEGGAQAAQIPSKARMLIQQVDKNFGGPTYKERFEIIIQRNGGVERLPTQPGVVPAK